MVKFKLEYPIEIAGKGKVSVLDVRERVQVGDLIFASKEGGEDSFSQNVALMARLCGLLAEDLHGMDAEDFNRLGELVAAAKKAKAPGSEIQKS